MKVTRINSINNFVDKLLFNFRLTSTKNNNMFKNRILIVVKNEIIKIN